MPLPPLLLLLLLPFRDVTSTAVTAKLATVFRNAAAESHFGALFSGCVAAARMSRTCSRWSDFYHLWECFFFSSSSLRVREQTRETKATTMGNGFLFFFLPRVLGEKV